MTTTEPVTHADSTGQIHVTCEWCGECALHPQETCSHGHRHAECCAGGEIRDGRPVRPASMDPIGWFIATTHQLLGHDTAAAVMGQPAGDKAECLLCQYERAPSRDQPVLRQAVIDAIGKGSPA